MIRNYLKIALRNLRRNQGYTFINIAGLSVSMACCLLIALYVGHELSFDTYHERSDRIYRLVEDLKTASETLPQATTSPPMAPRLQADFPEVSEAVRLDPDFALVSYETQQFEEDRIVYADANVFSVFSFDLIYGDPDEVLAAPYTVVLTESTARKYFGDADPIGKILTFDNESDFTVTGIAADVPENSHIQFDFLASFATWEAEHQDNLEAWFWNSFYTYILLPEGYNPAELEAKLPGFVDRHISADQERLNMYYTLRLEPLTEIYLQSDYLWQFQGISGSQENVYILSLIGLFILLIACINFMNLSTARSVKRSREVGLRKVLGAMRIQLIRQFLGEALLMTVCAMFLSIILVELLLPAFNTFTGKNLSLNLFGQWSTFLGLSFVTVVVGLLAGSYPAFVLSGFRPIRVLKGVLGTSKEGVLIRKGLVVFQFCISILLMAGTAVVYMQVTYMQNQNLGFDKEQVLVLNFGWDEHVQARIEQVKTELMKHPAVRKASASLSVPGEVNSNLGTTIELGNGEERNANLNTFMVDFDFMDLYGIDVVVGRSFSKEFSTDSLAFVLNEAAIAHIGFASPEDAVGKHVSQNGREGTVIGVVKDFNYQSLRYQVEPLIFHVLPDWFGLISLKLGTTDVMQSMAELETLWADLVPERPFNAVFLDEDFDLQYRSEIQFGSLTSIFAGLALLVACLGLFGLAAFTVQQRGKEIGIRKVLGATVPNIILLLSKDFLRLVLVAFVVAAPLAYVLMNRWLEDFAYRIDISIVVLPAVGGAALLIAWMTVGYQSARAALSDPVKALRYE